MWELEVDGAGGEHDEGEGGLCGVEDVAASDDEPDLGVGAYLERSVPTSVDLILDPPRRWR